MCLALLSAGFACTGCGGYYVLTVPDQVAPADGKAVATLRLQRNDFLVLILPEKGRPMRFSILPPSADTAGRTRTPEKSARTDADGYAGVTFSMPAPPVSGKPGTYTLCVDLQDRRGEKLHARARLFVWDPQREVVAVEMDALPMVGAAAEEAAAALRRLHAEANIVYLTNVSLRDREPQHRNLVESGYPDGPILLWEYRRWHVKRVGRFNMPVVTFKPHFAGRLESVQKQFPRFKTGICTTRNAERAFLESGLKAVVVGIAATGAEDVTGCPNWSRLDF